MLRGAATPAAHGEIVGLAAWHRGLVAAARRVEARGVPLLTAVDELDVMFDKRRCHALLRSRGVAVPEAYTADGYEEIRERGRQRGWRRVFVKPPHGSSASGVVALAFGGERGRVSAYTSAVLDGGRLFNELRVRHYTDERTIAEIIDRLAAEGRPAASGGEYASGGDYATGGLHVERWLAKASHDGLVFDLRVLVVAGRVSHVVVRTGRSPMTNLHLGNARGDLAGVRAAAGEERWAAAMRTCEAAAACFPRSLHVGVDLMFGRDYRTHAVAEVNAFGDLLPGLVAGGRDTYAAEIEALLSGRFTPAGVATPAAVTTPAPAAPALTGVAAPAVAAPAVGAPGVAAPGVAAPGVAAPGVAAPGVGAPGVAARVVAASSAVAPARVDGAADGGDEASPMLAGAR
ncbi:STM4014 family protein [Dactylosporangium aurantiacum]|uniref:STM4014 family protein n=1 Tax=Dactylosporangium aurantiacum TaxID=35754 RepID=UPI00069409C4|nr:STM4014 family protein [Dactylosporangium aurantiacum]MDG6102796.1 STM4014 family protein [Dactylosporangium aurantiacum]